MRTAYVKATIFGLLSVFGAAVTPSCGGSATEGGGTDSNTHWLDHCENDDQCGSLRCLCNVCTKTCDTGAACDELGSNAECRAACSDTTETVCVEAGPAPDGSTPAVSRACEKTSDCAITDKGCCSPCGIPMLDQVVAVNVDSVTAYQESVCGDNTGCPACAGPPNPTIYAICLEGQCEAIDVREQAGCDADADCQVRTRDCCECGGDVSPGGLVALSDPAGYVQAVCGPEQACDACLPIYPDVPTANCDPDLDVCVLDFAPKAQDAGAGGIPPEDCGLPPEVGNCDAAISRWYYDPISATCKQFTYGGCGGNANNFASLEECESWCAVRADSCICEAPTCLENILTCSPCPLTRDESGAACTVEGLECSYLESTCGATCTCIDDGTGALVWECGPLVCP